MVIGSASLDVTYALLATASMGVACACLSVFVVARRWAFIGEGIAHSGFGGAGAAWLLMLVIPAMGTAPWISYLGAIAFCLATALAIGYVSRSPRVQADTAIGIFMVGSLAFGFLAQQIFLQVRGHDPGGFPELLFGRLSGLGATYALAAVLVSLAVLLTLAALGKEIVYYCLDPQAAQTSGVASGFIHYLLMFLIALTIVIGLPIMGSVLVTALLILPAASANLLARRLGRVLGMAVAFALAASLIGAAVSLVWPFIPSGPVIVLLLFTQFGVAFTWARFPGRTSEALA